MPLIELKEVAKNRLLGLFRIEESYNELIEALNPQDLDRKILSSYSNMEKRKEWVSARLLLRYLCKELGIAYNGTRKDSNGKPFLQGHSMEISLSHSFPYIAVIADPKIEVGIDLEQPKDKLARISTRFLDERELALCGADIGRLTAFWCAKEALYKIYSKRGLNFKDDIHLYTHDNYPWSLITGVIDKNGEEKSYAIECEYQEDFIMAYNI
jgi:phosphopantetheinyl transferase